MGNRLENSKARGLRFEEKDDGIFAWVINLRPVLRHRRLTGAMSLDIGMYLGHYETLGHVDAL